MRVRVLSDLHLEAAPFDPPPAESDVVVLAGDIANGAAGIEWARRTFAQPVVFVAGNHEPFDAEFHATAAALKHAAQGSNVRVLDCEEAVLGGVRFLGCTLWSDFELYGAAWRDSAIDAVRRIAPDFRVIRFGDRPFAPDDWLALHRTHRAWLEERLAASFAGPTVVVTHFLPHPGSIAPKFASHALNPAFASRLETLVGRASLWIHGHTHAASDYRVGAARVVCNPRGYLGEPTGFRADLVVTL
jgi:predicted phosphodiesterase